MRLLAKTSHNSIPKRDRRRSGDREGIILKLDYVFWARSEEAFLVGSGGRTRANSQGPRLAMLLLLLASSRMSGLIWAVGKCQVSLHLSILSELT